MTKDSIKHKLFALADTLGMNLDITRESHIKGTGKRVLELFEGYSPTVISDIESGTIDSTNDTVMAQGRIWGNLGFVCVVEKNRDLISFFVYDRSRTPSSKEHTPFEPLQWSRKRLYHWLGVAGVRAVYYRHISDTDWSTLADGPAKIKRYNAAREESVRAKDAYELVWGV